MGYFKDRDQNQYREPCKEKIEFIFTEDNADQRKKKSGYSYKPTNGLVSYADEEKYCMWKHCPEVGGILGQLEMVLGALQIVFIGWNKLKGREEKPKKNQADKTKAW